MTDKVISSLYPWIPSSSFLFFFFFLFLFYSWNPSRSIFLFLLLFCPIFFPLPFLLRTCHSHTSCSLIQIPFFFFLPLYPFFIPYTSFVQLISISLPVISKKKLWPHWMLLQQSRLVAVKLAGNLVRKTLAFRAGNKTRAWRQYASLSCMTSLGNLPSDCESEVLAARLPSSI